MAEDYRPEVKEMWIDWEKRCEFVVDEINKIPKLSCPPIEGAFYAWIDISETGETSEALVRRLLEEKHIAFVPGSAFGATGEGYMRMTCVKSWDDLHAGLVRLKDGIS